MAAAQSIGNFIVRPLSATIPRSSFHVDWHRTQRNSTFISGTRKRSGVVREGGSERGGGFQLQKKRRIVPLETLLAAHGAGDGIELMALLKLMHCANPSRSSWTCAGMLLTKA
ncbi:hypothetical protein ERY430_30020 [Erythrobacter sp. EC-HK427]|nr:hypothetical protein ERY430_30020 [Erythrobacter sp. EC-HK427]